MASHHKTSGRSIDVVDCYPDHYSIPVQSSRFSTPVQSSDDTDPKEFSETFSKTANEHLASLDSGISSMHLGSPGFTSVQKSIGYDPTDTVNVYNMGYARRGHLVIINNHNFLPSTRMPERRGTDVDAAKLYATFKKLGFEVDIKNNLKCSSMMKLILDYADRDHSKCDCFAVAILTHGDTDGVVYGTDNVLPIKKLVEPIKNCKTLSGKPKLFFIQACRGADFDEGVDVTDAEVFTEPVRPSYRLPKEADFLYAYCTAPGYYAFRNSSKGSPFISAVATVFGEHATCLDVLRLMTRVNRMVAYDYESQANDTALCRKKQMPSFECMLTKELYFPPKK